MHNSFERSSFVKYTDKFFQIGYATLPFRRKVMHLTGAKALITGGAGFLGSYLAESLVSSGNLVYVVDDLSSGSIDNISQIWDCIKFQRADLTKWETWERIGKEWNGITHIFHLAAVVRGRENIEENPLSVSHNFFIDRNAIRFALEYGIKQFLYVSSSSVYPLNLQSKESQVKLREEFVDSYSKHPDSIYGWAKLIGELSLHDLSRSIDFRIVRPFSGYGPKQQSCYPLPAIMMKAMNKQDPLVVWGTGEQVRDFVYIDDLVEGILLASSSWQSRKVYNLCSGEGIKVKTLALKVAQTVEAMENTNYRPKIIGDSSKPTGVFNRVGDASRAKNELKWVPKVSLEEGIRRLYTYLKREFQD